MDINIAVAAPGDTYTERDGATRQVSADPVARIYSAYVNREYAGSAQPYVTAVSTSRP